MWEKVVYITSSYHLLLAYAGLGQGLPEVKPSTSGPLPVRLKELTGKLGWMKWEPVSLTGGGCQVRGGGHRLSVFYRQWCR